MKIFQNKRFAQKKKYFEIPGDKNNKNRKKNPGLWIFFYSNKL